MEVGVIRIQCQCGARAVLSPPAKYSGRRVRCKRCGHVQRAPGKKQRRQKSQPGRRPWETLVLPEDWDLVPSSIITPQLEWDFAEAETKIMTELEISQELCGWEQVAENRWRPFDSEITEWESGIWNRRASA